MEDTQDFTKTKTKSVLQHILSGPLPFWQFASIAPEGRIVRNVGHCYQYVQKIFDVIMNILDIWRASLAHRAAVSPLAQYCWSHDSQRFRPLPPRESESLYAPPVSLLVLYDVRFSRVAYRPVENRVNILSSRANCSRNWTGPSSGCPKVAPPAGSRTFPLISSTPYAPPPTGSMLRLLCPQSRFHHVAPR